MNERKVKIPNFILIGAGKSGTSSLHNYLNQHPDIFMSNLKEPMYFRYGYGSEKLVGDEPKYVKLLVDNEEKYLQLFEGVRNEKVIGESSVTYLVNPVCAERIKHFNPEMKIMAVLRNPVDRAFSFYKMAVRMGLESQSFKMAVDEELAGARDEDIQIRRYLFLCKSYDRVRVYMENFDKGSFKLFLYEDLSTKQKFFEEIFSFLGVDIEVLPDISKKYNQSVEAPYHPFYQQLYMQMRKRNLLRFYPSWLSKKYLPSMDEKLRSKLIDYFYEDTKKLQDLIDRNLDHWLV